MKTLNPSHPERLTNTKDQWSCPPLAVGPALPELRLEWRVPTLQGDYRQAAACLFL